MGRGWMPRGEAEALEPGSVVALDAAAGADVDVLLAGRRAAVAEPVDPRGRFAVRVRRVADDAEGGRER